MMFWLKIEKNSVGVQKTGPLYTDAMFGRKLKVQKAKVFKQYFQSHQNEDSAAGELRA